MGVDRDRLRTDIEENAAFGALEDRSGHGRTVLTGSEADRACRDRLRGRMEAEGMDIRVDPVGNILGRWVAPTADPDAAPVGVGSHLDSVPEGGIFDGPLGVYGALEAVRAIKAAEVEPVRPLDVVSFTEEEGARFGVGLLGSSVAAGRTPESEALALEDDDGVSLAEHLDRIGYAGEHAIDVADWAGWAELHIEQGSRLERSETAVGVVEAIAGLANCTVEIRGEANHAGTTPMETRRDAMTAAAELVLGIEERARERASADDESTVGTAGNVTVRPNAKNTVPGRVTLTTDHRSVEGGEIDALVEGLREDARTLEASRPVATTVDRYRDTPPTKLSERAVQTAIEAIDERGITSKVMHSGALHDTAVVADRTDAVLLFAPSTDGISHSPQEWTDWTDCARATEALAATVARLATD